MTKQLTYGDVFIGTWEEDYIDMFEDLALEIAPDLDINKAPIYPGQSVTIANDIIRYMYEECIWALDISEDSKNKLTESICVNSIDSWIDSDVSQFPLKEASQISRVFRIEGKIKDLVSNRTTSISNRE